MHKNGIDTAENPIPDVKCVAERVRALPDTRVYFERSSNGPTTKELLKNTIRDFVKKIDQQNPFLIHESGLGMQDGANIYVVHTKANQNGKTTSRDQCRSHDELFQILNLNFDNHIDVEDILYFFLLDACRAVL